MTGTIGMSAPNRRVLRLGAAVLCVLSLLVVLQATADAAALMRGSKGDDVIKLQKKLKAWGYYTGAVDGDFGPKTEEAVKYFQRKNGLSVDGIVGTATARELGLTLSGSSGSSGSSSSSQQTASGDTRLLARAVYGEARGESYKGQVAVAAVILNRVDSAQFPNSISGVIYQQGAFSVVADGQINLTPDDTAIRAAKDAMNGYDPTGGCLYYYNPDKTSNAWIRSRPIVTRIGRHVFCK